MKRFMNIFVASTLAVTTLITPMNVFAGEISVTVDGKEVKFDQAPIVEEERTLVPFRAIFEAMGAEVNWDGNTKTVTGTKDGNTVTLVINNNEMIVNDGKVELDVPAKIENERTLVPIRAISEGLGAEVKWDENTKAITITSKTTDKEPVKTIEETDKADVKFESYDLSVKADDDTEVLKISYKYPVIDSKDDTAKKINEISKQKAEENAKADEKEYAAEAKELYTIKKEAGDKFNTLQISSDAEVTYYEDNKLSILFTESVDLGGAHPSTTKKGITLYKKTGEKAEIADLDAKKATAKAAFEKMIEDDKEKQEIGFFEDSKIDMDSDDVYYYLTKDGMLFGIQQAVIAPYAYGFVEYTVKNDAESKETVKEEKKETDKKEDKKETKTSEAVKVKEEKISETLRAEDFDDVPYITMDITYPVLEGDSKGIAAINKYYKEYAESIEEDFRDVYGDAAHDAVGEYLKEEDADSKKFQPYDMTTKIEVKYNKDNKISILTTIESYSQGAHENYFIEGYTFDLTTGEKLELKDLVDDETATLKAAEEGFKAMDGLIDKVDMNLVSYYLTDKGVEFAFAPMVILPFSEGVVTYTVE